MMKIQRLLSVALCALTFLACGNASAVSVSAPKPSASKGTYSGYVLVKWSKVSKATGGYYVKRGTSSKYSDATTIKKVSKSTKSYKDKSAVKGRKYYYWVCPIRGKYYYYNTSRYAQGYRKGSTSSSSSGSSGIVGNSKLSYSRFNTYYLKVNGKPVASTAVRWSCSGRAFMLGAAGYGKLLADVRPSSSFTVTVKAVYNRKTYTKKVKIYRNGTYGRAGSTVYHTWRFCSKHGWYDASHSVGCPSCRGTLHF